MYKGVTDEKSGLTEEAFVEEAYRLQKEYFLPIAEEMEMTEETIEEYMAGAKEMTSAELPMYLNEEGILCVYVPFPSVAGADWYYHLCEF